MQVPRINRNILECKEMCFMEMNLHGNRINRNILECKGRKEENMSMNGIGINRNILECKGNRYIHFMIFFPY